MLEKEIFESLENDIEDLKGIINYKEYGLTKEMMRKQARGVLLNIEDHLRDILNL